MKKLSFLIALFAIAAWAADFWQSKPFTDWSEKDVQKILQNSPWSRQFNVPIPGRAIEGAPSGGGNRTRGASPDPGQIGPSNTGPAGAADEGGLGRYAGSRGDSGAQGPVAPTTTLIIRWQSSLPVREAIVKIKYGNETATSPEAKKALETPLDHYIIAVSGLPRPLLGPVSRGSGDDVKKTMLENGALIIKGREPIKPDDFMLQQGGRLAEALFAFPKTAPITMDDKEVEFTLKIGDVNIKQKFRLKDMLINGKLDL